MRRDPLWQQLIPLSLLQLKGETMARRKYRFSDRAEAEAEYLKADQERLNWYWAFLAMQQNRLTWRDPIPVCESDGTPDGTVRVGWFLTPSSRNIMAVVENNGDPASYMVGELLEMIGRATECDSVCPSTYYWRELRRELLAINMATVAV